MNKKRTFYIILFLVILFTGTNLYFIEKANSKVDREVRIEEWDAFDKDDLQRELPKSGVVTSAEETYLYFNDEFGSFKKFLVKEGDEVKAGTPLYEYEVTDYTGQKDVLESEIDQLEDEIDSIEDNISDLERLENTLPSSYDEEEMPLEASALETEYDLKKEIAARELEVDRLENQIDSLESQISDLESYETTLTVESSGDGIVKDLSHSVQNPLITIASEATIVTTDLTEKEIMEVEEKMNAKVQSEVEKKTQKGIVSDVSSLPKRDPHLETDSMYPIKIQLQDKDNKLLPGHHVLVSVITDEVKNTLVVPITAVEKSGTKKHVWVLTDKGTVKKKVVETGLQVDGKIQIKSGVKAGEYFIVNPDVVPALRNGASFITALDWDKIKLRDLKKMDRPTVLENLLLGILERK
ncbi:efflux RND transporter periplasmic adaptor subunit [Bacillus sp. Marseille-Q1617]|uniref:efflux RND transporter periplasmic adaptor subunit n=1 Tax=Bacillus sp. Marseille-Q1617 TaxID=2736887 RepID=UPI00158D0065|nr:biotin/lipoyl-binding protein [Bacillus sp. Marseille-Q1617]